MPLEGDAPNIVDYKMPINGVNLNDGRLGITETQALQLKNLYVRGGIKKRSGFSKRQDDPIDYGANKVHAIHRFYKQDNTSDLLVYGSGHMYAESSDAQRDILANGVGTTLHDATSQQENGFDDDTTKLASEGAIKTSATSFTLGKTWPLGVARILSGVSIYSSSDEGFVTGINPDVTITLEGSNDAFATAGVTLATLGPTTDSNGLTMTDNSVTETVAYTSHRVVVTHDGASATMNIAEVVFRHTTPWQPLIGTMGDTDVRMTTWGATNKVYVANTGTDAITIDSSLSTSTITQLVNESVVPLQFLEYQDRLLMISSSEPGTLRWSHSFDDTQWVSAASTGVQPDSYLHGMIIHNAADNQEQGQNAQVLLAGSSGMYLFSGTNLSLTFSNYTIQQLATRVGCIAPKSMTWTPMGTMWLGTDLQVYLLPFESIVPIPVGEPIRSKIFGFDGIENLSAANMPLVEAVYQDGFYKLSYPASTATFPDTQWWMDVFSSFSRSNSQSIVNRALSVGWFGPMDGMNFSTMEVLNGSGDTGDLVAGEGDTSVGAYVYDSTGSEVTDDGTSIAYNWRSYFNPLSSPFMNSICHLLEVEVLNTIQTINMSFDDTAGGGSDSISTIDISDTGAIYNEVYYGEVYYGGLGQSRIRAGIDPPLNQRFVSVNMSGDTSQKFELFAFRLREEQQSATLGVRRG